jgi:hypothetical protein
MKKIKWCEYSPWSHIHSTSLSSILLNVTNKLDYLTLTCLSSLVLCNTRAYWGLWIHYSFKLHKLMNTQTDRQTDSLAEI